MNSYNLQRQHEELATRLLGIVIVRPDLLYKDDVLARVTVAHMPTQKLAAGWTAVQARLSSGGVPDGATLAVSEIMPHANGNITGNDLHYCIAAGGVPREIELVSDTAQLVLEMARARERIRQFQEAIEALNTGESLPVVDERVLTATTIEYGTEIDHDLAGGLDEVFDSPPVEGQSTGIDWLDQVTGGVLQNEYWLIGGRYKGGKTRTARHILLHRLIMGEMCSFFAIEGTWIPFGLDMVALLATKRLLASGALKETTLSGRLLRRLGNRWQESLSCIQVDAIQDARRQLRKWSDSKQLRIYTKERTHGAIQSIDDVRRFLRLDTAQGVTFGAYDYAQRFDDQPSLFDSMRQVALTSQDIVQEMPISLLGLVQLNEAKNKDNVEGDELGGSAGIKGGGDLPASADTFITTSYDLDSFNDAKERNRPDGEMTLKLWFSRYESAAQAKFLVNRTSGLIKGRIEKE